MKNSSEHLPLHEASTAIFLLYQKKQIPHRTQMAEPRLRALRSKETSALPSLKLPIALDPKIYLPNSHPRTVPLPAFLSVTVDSLMDHNQRLLPPNGTADPKSTDSDPVIIGEIGRNAKAQPGDGHNALRRFERDAVLEGPRRVEGRRAAG